MEQADTLEYLKDRIKEFLLRPASLSKGKNARIRDGFDSQNVAMTTKVAANVLNDIRAMDAELAEKLKGYTPHDSCQTSLIREVLLEIRNAGVLNTQPISVIGALSGSRIVSSEVMA